MDQLDRETFLTFVGHLSDEDDCLVITGRTGRVALLGTAEELRDVRAFLRAMDGFAPLSELPKGSEPFLSQRKALLSALNNIGAILDLARGWSWFHDLSSNPPTVPMIHDPMAAYDMPRMAIVDGDHEIKEVYSELTIVDELAGTRHSAELQFVAAAPYASLRSAIRLALNAYTPKSNGHRPAASGGALYPLHFWVVGSENLTSTRDVLGIDHDRDHVKYTGKIELKELRQLFVPDPAVETALDRGAAIIVIAADPRRITHKYGNRGWRYAFIECGAVMHHIMLAAASRGEAVRPIAGYYDAALRSAVSHPALPLLTILVAVPL